MTAGFPFSIAEETTLFPWEFHAKDSFVLSLLHRVSPYPQTSAPRDRCCSLSSYAAYIGRPI
eukprot:1872999-Rhodomonas_salina.1